MPIRDYNGSDHWTVAAVQSRYLRHCAGLNVQPSRPLQPFVHRDGDTMWIYPIMDPVIEGIRAGDPACAILGVEFIEEDAKFPFGRSLKSRAAHALKAAELSDVLKDRIRHRVAQMLAAGNTPREFKDYARLLRKIGFDELWPRMAASPPLANKHAMRHFAYFRAIYERSPGAGPHPR